MIKPLAAIGAVLLLAACGSGDPTPGSVSPGEAQQLNDAAEMLDADSVDINAVGIDGENAARSE